jgi:hypothetical protein
MKKHRSKARRPLTPAQRLAIEKRQTEQEFQWRLEMLLQTLNNPAVIPHNQRFGTINALCCVAGAGHLFARACGKAAVSRTNTANPDPAAFWAFIDAENARFAARMNPKIVAAWNAPDYEPAPAAKEQAA